MISLFLLVSASVYALEVTGNNNHIIEVETNNERTTYTSPDGDHLATYDNDGNTTVKYVFLDGAFNFNDSGFSLGYHAAKKKDSGSDDLNILEIYPRYTFESINGWTPGIELGYKTEDEKEVVRVKPSLNGNIGSVGLYTQFVFEDNLDTSWQLYEFLVKPSYKVNDKLSFGSEFIYAQEKLDNGSGKDFDKYLIKPFVNYTINDKWSVWGAVEVVKLNYTDKVGTFEIIGSTTSSIYDVTFEDHDKLEIKPMVGAAYKLSDNLNVFGEVSYKWAKGDQRIINIYNRTDYINEEVKANVPFFKVGLGYNW